jgi:hypothetical protein
MLEYNYEIDTEELSTDIAKALVIPQEFISADLEVDYRFIPGERCVFYSEQDTIEIEKIVVVALQTETGRFYTTREQGEYLGRYFDWEELDRPCKLDYIHHEDQSIIERADRLNNDKLNWEL